MVKETAYSFGAFEFDSATGELRKRGIPVRLPEQACRILRLLLERPGQIVGRETLRTALWPDGTFVEFERSLNAAVAKLRQALGDSAENPRYIETVAGQGYTFIAPVVDQHPEPDIAAISATPPANSPVRLILVCVLAGAAALAILAWAALRFRPASPPGGSTLTRLTFDSGLTTDPAVSPDGKLLAYASDRGGGPLHIWVQQMVPNGQAVQLTRGEWDDHQPAFSSDGSTIAFRSERAGGGIYLIPALGGEARLLAKAGRDPRFSPDGRTVAYWESAVVGAPFFAGAHAVSLVDVESGATHPFKGGLVDAGMPEWSPDGNSLIVFGRSREGPPWLGDWDWWIVGVNDRTREGTGLLPLLRTGGFETMGLKAPRVSRWREGQLFFTALRGDSVNVWSININRGHVAGQPQRLTSGNEFDVCPTPTAGGRMVFAALSVASDVWGVPIDANSAVVKGPRQKLTQTAGPHYYASLNTEGNLLAFSSLRYGKHRAMVRNLTTGEETPVGNGAQNEMGIQISKDGSLVAYSNDRVVFAGNGTGHVMSLDSRASEVYCRECMGAYDTSPDNSVVLYHKNAQTISAYNRRSHQDTVFIASDRFETYQQQYSFDGKWITFGRSPHAGPGLEIFVARLINPTTVAPEKEWIKISGDETWPDKPRWSPDARWLYYLSNRDGFFCLWAQRLDSKTKHPVGGPVAIEHMHTNRYAVGNTGIAGLISISVARDKIAFNMGELTGNIWSVDTDP